MTTTRTVYGRIHEGTGAVIAAPANLQRPGWVGRSLYYAVEGVPEDVSDEQARRAMDQAAMMGGGTLLTDRRGGCIHEKRRGPSHPDAWTWRWTDLGKGRICYPRSTGYRNPTTMAADPLPEDAPCVIVPARRS